LWRYFREKAVEQIKSVWFIIAYLILFQMLLLDLPIVHSWTIAAGIAIVVIGLTFFMEGLRLGLMPFGETIGAILPRNSKLPVIMLFAFILGMAATFAEPAISVLKKAGAGVLPSQAPLLYSLLNDFSNQLVICVGIGVGVAVTLGILRFFFGWSLKVLIIPIVLILTGLTVYAYFDPILKPVIGLAWDCGAVTTGPVTVPLVLALGIGVCRIIGDDQSASGFGIVTLVSLFPIIAVMSLALYHFFAQDYYGAPKFTGELVAEVAAPVSVPSEPKVEAEPETPAPEEAKKASGFTEDEFSTYLASGNQEDLGKKYRVVYQGGEVTLEDGRIVHRGGEIVFEKKETTNVFRRFVVAVRNTAQPWDPELKILNELKSSLLLAVQAILPLCAFLFLTLLVLLRERLRRGDEIAIGVAFAVVGMGLFALGLTLGLTPLGTQLGSNVPITFASIQPWGLTDDAGPIFGNPMVGKIIAILFAFFLGYGATLAEPALNALGQTVEDTTVGVFKKSLLMQTVALGVGMGIAAGVAQMAFANLQLAWLLIPPYLVLLFLTAISSEEFVNFAWDSAGVTTGPITVPLVLAMGLGVGANIPGVIDGFGILALASVGPIITVISVGLIVNQTRRQEAVAVGSDENF
ncbi:MAG: DUF1538 domain-containing protein, partial [Verrucomicrobiota bacterium]